MKKTLWGIVLCCGAACAVAQRVQHVQHTFKSDKFQPDSFRADPGIRPLIYDYYHSLGAACKAELKFEKSTSIPLRLRVGLIEQADFLEQKPNAKQPGQ
ncbi:MAG TPA: hypothetical protein VL098_02190 [Flavipsychrobacter sp.]|nr:hypothetical protein [Flavipsychrobacter sp.]